MSENDTFDNDAVDTQTSADERLARLEEEGDFAADYLEELMDLSLIHI